MCGIAGYIRPDAPPDLDLLNRMTAAVGHRGPDGSGTWLDAARGVALGHTRLRIIDLSEAAHQPMVSADGSTVLTFNGEIYNFRELRDELFAAGANFCSTGDTAVLLELCRRDPTLGFLPRLSGMFAFAVWHAPTATLSIARDRTGVKPVLHAALPGGGIAFASELRSLRLALDGAAAVDREAAVQLLMMGFIGAPRTILSGVSRLPPGHMLRWSATGGCSVSRWSSEPPATTDIRDIGEAKARLRAAMRDAVATRMLADVPVGLFLSGGIDSSVVTAVAAQLGGPRVRTFSVGFPDEPFFDETRYAQAVASRWNTDHTVLPLTIAEVRDVIPDVLDHLSEPFADSSALPTYLLSRLTRRHVTVALSGDGADELFAGYRRYAAARLAKWLGWAGRVPGYGLLRGAVERLPTRRETFWGSRVSQLKRAMRTLAPDRRVRYANWQRISDDATLAALLANPFDAPRYVTRCADYLWGHRGEPRDSDDLNRHLRTEWRTSLPDDMLMKVDLMSMAHGLEVRSPFLDNAVVDLVSPLPSWMKLNGWKKKHLLIEAYRDDLPPMLHNRPKKGFEVPVGPWLRGPLYDMARDLINSDDVLCGPLLSRSGALRLLDDHRAGRADHNFTLWSVVALLWWRRAHGAGCALSSGD